MDEILGVPAHPLFVHVPVVLLPGLGLVACAFVVRPAWRQRYAAPFLVVTLVTTIITILAARSGESLEDALQPALGTTIDRHAELGDQTALLATLFAVAAASVVGADWWFLRRPTDLAPDPVRSRSRTMQLASAGVAALAILATVWVIRAGHEGARVTWSGVEVGG